ncbi:MAG: tetratricopeptide repeat protein [Burkholderiales bacterium]
MASNESRSPAPPDLPRQRLTSPWTLLGVAVVVGVTLVLIFPGRGLLTQSSRQKPDEVSLTYLSNLAREQPDNPEVRFTLAQKQVEAGRIPDARAALEPLYNSPDPAVRQRARLTDFKLQMQQMQALPPNSIERQRESERLRQELVAMTQYEWNAAGLLDLANLATQLNAPKLRAELYLRIARSDNKLSRQWTDEAARAVLADGEYATAAEIYFIAQRRAESRADQRYYFIAALNAYQAGNMVREAVAAADQHLGALEDDDETLRYLIRLARMGNDMPRAERYAKKLLRMSQQNALMQWLNALLERVVRPARAADARPGMTDNAMLGMRPYNREDYELAYDVFLANRNLKDAYRVAAAAVQQVPNDIAWRERLAQISEWSDRPADALQQWLYIARRTGRPAAWQGVLRLAPGLFDDEALLEGLRYEATRSNLTDDQLRAVVEAYERVGRPHEGIAFLEREYARRPRPLMLEQQAYLMERMGDLDGAIAAYRRLIQRSGASTDRVAKLATLLIARGEPKGAYALLERHSKNVPPQDADYWRLLSELAWQLQDDAGAERAYRVLTGTGKATPDDLERLIVLVQARDPEIAAQLAEAAYTRFPTQQFFMLALRAHSERRDWIAVRRLLSSVPPELERSLERDPEFLLMRAEYRMATGSPDLALADYRSALKIDPANRYARIALLWFLIDRRDIAALKAEMPQAMARAKDDPEFDGVLGAAWLTLDDPARAVAHFARVLQRNPGDYLWLLNYADALEQNNQAEMAWRVRRHAWVKVREELAKSRSGVRPPLQLLQAQARLALQFTPGDPGLAVLRNLLRQDEAAGAPSADARRRGLDAGTRELVLSWLISDEQWISAKTWLWKQYGRNLAKPVWAEASVALAENDVETLQRLLEAQADAIPRYDRHEAARRTQQYRLAQDIAFTSLERIPHDDEMHLRLTQSVLDMINSAELGYTHFTRGLIRGNELTGEAAFWLSPRLRLSFDLSVIDQSTTNTGALATVPGRDRLYGVTALFRHAIGETRLSVFYRDALSGTTGGRASYQRPLGPRVTGRIGLAYQERALETSALAAGGMRDRAFVDLEYNFSKREYVLGEVFASRYHTQERTFIGSGYGLNWELGHRFRTEYPDWNVRLAGSINHFDQSGTGDAATAVLVPGGTIPTAAFFLPPSFSVYGIYTGFGTFYQTTYTRGVRPFADIGVNHNTVTGAGYSALLGLSGSVLGADRLTVYASSARGGNGTGLTSREVGVRYMYMFDPF